MQNSLITKWQIPQFLTSFFDHQSFKFFQRYIWDTFLLIREMKSVTPLQANRLMSFSNWYLEQNISSEPISDNFSDTKEEQNKSCQLELLWPYVSYKETTPFSFLRRCSIIRIFQNQQLFLKY
ncbi:Hypothetical_protein [Hexamita inflata]|uniref:Hypothetical_protein n=1 Tax=Hexamita inflata TaxID=28002 RepID=A0AA86NXK6_9EUKA|nr:Hypothetical protein HINF_LOCUS14873 [Hexamita inflata]